MLIDAGKEEGEEGGWKLLEDGRARGGRRAPHGGCARKCILGTEQKEGRGTCRVSWQ